VHRRADAKTPACDLTIRRTSVASASTSSIGFGGSLWVEDCVELPHDLEAHDDPGVDHLRRDLDRDLAIRIVHAATGEVLRELSIDPTNDYQPRTPK